MSEPVTPFQMVGDADAGICVDGVCALPTPPDPDLVPLLRTNLQVGSAKRAHDWGVGD